MTQNNFSANVRPENGSPVLQFHGDINGFAEDAMNEAYTNADAVSSGKIVFDFSDVDYINSTGIALIVGLLARARMAHRVIHATGLSDHYREIFTITRLSDFMELH